MIPSNISPALRERLRDSQNELVAAVIECFGPDSDLIQELGGFDFTINEEEVAGSTGWYDEYLESEKE